MFVCVSIGSLSCLYLDAPASLQRIRLKQVFVPRRHSPPFQSDQPAQLARPDGSEAGARSRATPRLPRGTDPPLAGGTSERTGEQRGRAGARNVGWCWSDGAGHDIRSLTRPKRHFKCAQRRLLRRVSASSVAGWAGHCGLAGRAFHKACAALGTERTTKECDSAGVFGGRWLGKRASTATTEV